jgi:general secretion pathway protein I
LFRAISSETEASGQAGFTLVEVLVALSVVAVSLAAIGSLIARSDRSSR